MNERKYFIKYFVILVVEGLRRQKEDNVMFLVVLIWINIQKVYVCFGIFVNINLDSKVQQIFLQDVKIDKVGFFYL